MVSASRDCAVCCAEIPVVTLRKQHYEDEGETSADTEHGTGQNLQSFPPDEALQTCSESHRLDICYSCLDLHISTSLDTRGPAACNAIQCPKPTCHHIYTFDEIKEIASPTTFSRYDYLLTRNVLGEDPSFRWCLRPGCGSGATYHTGDIWEELGCRGMVFEYDARLTEPGRWIRCPDCSFDMCFAHQVPCPVQFRRPLDQTDDPVWTLSAQGCALCRQDLLDLGSEDSTETWIAKNTKRCPRIGCGVLIEKNSGCLHMHCAYCKLDFCWDCMGEYDLQDNCCGGCSEPGSDYECGDVVRRNQSRATDFPTSDDIYSQALWEFTYQYESTRVRIWELEGLGVLPRTQQWDPSPPPLPLPHLQPRPQEHVPVDNSHQNQDLRRLTADQHGYAQNLNRQVQAETMSQDERTAQSTTTTGTVSPYQNTNITVSRGGHQTIAVSTTPGPAPIVTEAIYSQPGPSTYQGPNYSNYPRP